MKSWREFLAEHTPTHSIGADRTVYQNDYKKIREIMTLPQPARDKYLKNLPIADVVDILWKAKRYGFIKV